MIQNAIASNNKSLIAAGILLGLGQAGFFDGIIFHQLLQWHHMFTNVESGNTRCWFGTKHPWRSNRLLSVRRVSQDNRGKKTAGVDGIKSLTPTARIKLAKQLTIKGKSKATLRVWIPKPGKDEKRPLGIPTMHDRALQGVIKNAIKPEWEAVFEPNSYGFVRFVGVTK